jgi:putative salt-induced outer membrane protein YdiY
MHNKPFWKLFCVLLAAVAFAVLPFPGLFTAGGTALAQSSFSDIGDQPADIQQAIEYSAAAGYMQGAGDGTFHPNDATTRIDCAKALVTIFDHADEEADHYHFHRYSERRSQLHLGQPGC